MNSETRNICVLLNKAFPTVTITFKFSAVVIQPRSPLVYPDSERKGESDLFNHNHIFRKQISISRIQESKFIIAPMQPYLYKKIPCLHTRNPPCSQTNTINLSPHPCHEPILTTTPSPTQPPPPPAPTPRPTPARYPSASPHQGGRPRPNQDLQRPAD